MKYIKTLSLLLITFIVFSCSRINNEKSSVKSLVEERITQKIDIDAMGTIKDLKIISVKKVNDTTYKAIYTFINEMVNKEIRVTRNYTFTINLDSITNEEDLKTEMKSEGEWKAWF